MRLRRVAIEQVPLVEAALLESGLGIAEATLVGAGDVDQPEIGAPRVQHDSKVLR